MIKRILLAIAFMAIGAPAAHARDLGYDPKADPFDQYHEAVAIAEAEKKLVLVIAGGDWCRWCHVLNRFLDRNLDIQQRLEDAFVVVKVYVGDENYNADFFEQLPEARGAPQFWIISPERNVLASQSTGALERGKNGYDKHEFLQFIAHWKARTAAVGEVAVEELGAEPGKTAKRTREVDSESALGYATL